MILIIVLLTISEIHIRNLLCLVLIILSPAWTWFQLGLASISSRARTRSLLVHKPSQNPRSPDHQSNHFHFFQKRLENCECQMSAGDICALWALCKMRHQFRLKWVTLVPSNSFCEDLWNLIAWIRIWRIPSNEQFPHFIQGDEFVFLQNTDIRPFPQRHSVEWSLTSLRGR